jgi:uncharacterized protein YidB (DUF937 family)
MALIDSLIREVDERFGLGNKSAPFIAEVVRYLFEGKNEGIGGFIDRCQSAGLGKTTASWLAKNTDNLPVTGVQLDQVLEGGFVSRLGSLFSLAGSTVRNVLVFVVPRLVDLLTPDGVIPKTIPADLQSFLNSAAASYRSLPAATPLEARRHDGSIGPWAWLAALLWSGLLAYWALTGPRDAEAPQAAAVQPQASLPARLALSNDDGKIEFSGVVGDEKTRNSILDLLKGVFGEGRLSGRLDVDPRVGPAAWLSHLGELLRQFNLPGADLLTPETRWPTSVCPSSARSRCETP